MKKLFLIFVFLIFAISNSYDAFAQIETEVRNFPKNSQNQEFQLKSSRLIHDEKIGSKVFEIEVLQAGNYWLSAFFMPTYEKDTLNPIQVFLDKENKPIGTLQAAKNGWQATFLKSEDNRNDKSIYLNKGIHHLVFTSNNEDYPLVDDIKLAQAKTNALISESEYQNFQNPLTKSSIVSPNKSGGITPQIVLPNPNGNYQHDIDTQINYTFWLPIYLTYGSVITLETKNSSGADPVLYLFNADNPNNGSWVNDNFSGVESKLTVGIPATGNYIILIRASNTNISGTCNLWKDGALWISGCDVAGKNWTVPVKNGIPTNAFTCKLTGSPNPDTRIYVAPSATTPIKAYNDDYVGTGNFAWGNASRVKGVYNTGFVLATTRIANFPTCTADVYMNVEPSNLYTSEPNLYPNAKVDDIMKSGSGASYNCFAWVGGVTNKYFTTWDDYWDWYDAVPIQSMDRFLGNNPPRYAGAYTYTRSGATANNSEIDIWGFTNEAHARHASIRKPGNNHPHGYDWESKGGSFDRTMHPRYDIGGLAFGSVIYNYRYTGQMAMRFTTTEPNITFEESIQKGYSRIEKNFLNEEEKKS